MNGSIFLLDGKNTSIEFSFYKALNFKLVDEVKLFINGTKNEFDWLSNFKNEFDWSAARAKWQTGRILTSLSSGHQNLMAADGSKARLSC